MSHFHVTASKHSTEKYILALGFSPSQQGRHGGTSQHMAARHGAKGVHIMVGWKAESRKGPGATITFKNMSLRTHLLQLNLTSSSSTASQSCANSRGTGTQHVSLEWTVAFQPKTPNHVKYGLGLEHGLWIPL